MVEFVEAFASTTPTAAAASASPSAIAAPMTSFGEVDDSIRGDVLRAFEHARADLVWRQNRTYTDAEFLKRYAYTELLGPTGLVRSESVSAGLLVLDAHTFYPPHAHPAEEVYHLLSGTSEWQQGDGCAVVLEAGARIHHGSAEPHSMRTGADALVALYLWRGDLHSPARFVAVT